LIESLLIYMQIYYITGYRMKEDILFLVEI
jgi:hypothetical protein